jgi:hypothetical protein
VGAKKTVSPLRPSRLVLGSTTTAGSRALSRRLHGRDLLLTTHIHLTVDAKAVHTLVTLPRTVTLPVTDMIRSYDLNFNPVPHDVTVSFERYTVGFPVCYESQKHHECKEGERSGRW